MEIKIIASGSTGNAYWISDGKTELLVEAGIPASKLKKGLNFRLSKMDGCLITHEHKDHSKAVLDVLKAGVDVYCTEGTAKALGITEMEWRKVIQGTTFKIGSLVIAPFIVKHDAAEPVGFVIQSIHTFEKLLFATDTVDIPVKPISLTHIMIECNYDEALLQEHLESGTMPERLQNRVEASHLSLGQCINILSLLDLTQVRAIYLLHLSQQHSDKYRFIKTIQTLTGKPTYTETGRGITMNNCNETETTGRVAASGTATCYIVIWQDRHSDTTVHPFTDKDKAISEAKRIAKEYCKKYPEDYKEEHIGGWLFYAQYSCEPDHVRVVEAQMNKEM